MIQTLQDVHTLGAIILVLIVLAFEFGVARKNYRTRRVRNRHTRVTDPLNVHP